VKTSTAAHLTPTTYLTPGQWLGSASVHCHAEGTSPDDDESFLSLMGTPDDLERLAAACIEAANLARTRGNAA
jgi:hypothetical protein